MTKNLDAVIFVRVPTALKGSLDEQARAMGISVSDLVRLTLMEKLNSGTKFFFDSATPDSNEMMPTSEACQ